ncbi:MAG TPA: carboxypeptidase-like regulatory domain-containing protein [Pyrinomonadaceae bacterium]|nr:carboxypeptidase-like regulatory domain-containing protein [Pyrinomonadaceae bacterium]
MSHTPRAFGIAVLLLIAIMIGCKASGNKNAASSNNGRTGPTSSNDNSNRTADDKGIIHSGAGEEKEKPADGKANVQGRVLFNSVGAANIEVKLCEKFNQYFGGCQGKTYATKTDANGDYLIKDVPPGIYEGLIAKVFDTPYYVFATSGLISSDKYQIESDQTFFAPDSNLFKSNLKLLSPKAAAKVSPDNLELKWESYPDAAYYKFSLYADTNTGAETNYDYINKRVDGTSYALDKPLSAGSYRIVVIAYNGKDIKIAQSPDDIKFTVAGH